MYTIKSHDTRVNTAFERMCKGYMHDETLIPYTPKFIKDAILYFEEREEYEKCQKLKDKLLIVDHEKNYTKWTQRQMI
jgi:hypothetical protein